ncbi:NPCBM/NEW2 domain-containing protein, partial [Singulisphaera rosea]
DRLPPTPPLPEIALSDLTPTRMVGPSHSFGGKARYSAHSGPPRRDLSNEGIPLRLRGKDYAKGMGVHASNQLMYDLKPEYGRFVALVGVDEGILKVSNGSNVARYPSVVFKVFVDGKQLAESPVLRISMPPWGFNVAIPPGAKQISLVATDAGDGNREDFADWVDAGFVLRATP